MVDGGRPWFSALGVAMLLLIVDYISPGVTADLLLQARCQALCSQHDQQQCQDECALKATPKPGDCPGSSAPPLTLACLEECSADADCPGLDKCCHHSCGVTCQPPDNLDHHPGLPDVPENVTVTERRKSRSVTVTWNRSVDGAGGVVVYLVEWRQAPGWKFKESAVGRWTPARRRPLPVPCLKTALAPATWYQFRIASVNTNGTRGFSTASKPFKLSMPPSRPGPPENLSTGPVTYKNNTITVILKWKPPLSDLPISRYIVSWSRRITSDQLPADQGSLVMHQKTIGSDKTSFRLKNLLPDSIYFLQVQAQAQYGKKRYQSEASRMVFHTSGPSDQGT